MSPVAAPETIAPALLAWWAEHGRKNLPWQHEPTRYRVWVSEIMLQQTQVPTVERYYDRFMRRFPDVATLAAADTDEVLHLWSGLGYYARARNLHQSSRIIVEQYNGELPGRLDALLSLPGIGRSTAGAILALADNQRQPILDGNAKRVYARYFAIEGWPGRSAVAAALWAVAEQCTSGANPSVYTQAIMDLGSTLCVRSVPACDRCPLAGNCQALAQDRIADIPGRKPRKKKPLRQIAVVLAVRQDGAVLLQKRPDAGIWGGLWSFPETATADEVSDWCREHVGADAHSRRILPVVEHSFTHFDLRMTPVEIRFDTVDQRLMDGNDWLWYNRDEPATVGLAAPVGRMLAGIGDST